MFLLQEELHSLKLKVHEIVEENRILHEELKTSVIQEILQEGIDVPGVCIWIYVDVIIFGCTYYVNKPGCILSVPMRHALLYDMQLRYLYIGVLNVLFIQ